MLLKEVPAYIRRLVRISNSILEKIPNRNDTKILTTIKVISLLDSALEFVYGAPNEAIEYLKRFNVEEKNNKQFVNLFLSPIIQKDFKKTYITVSPEQCVIKINIPDIGILFFIKWIYDKRHSEIFYHTKGFDFKKILSKIWNMYNGKIFISFGESWNNKNQGASFSEFVIPNTEIFGSANYFIEKLLEKDKQYRKDKIHRCILFVGRPGTGKTSAALKVVAHSNRVLKLNAGSLIDINVEDMQFLLDGLCPEYILIDDVDRVLTMTTSTATLLSILDSVKTTNPETMFLLTANSTEDISEALKRPGRIDEIIEFKIQNKKERKSILKGYLKEYNLKLSLEQINKIVNITKGLSAAYIKEIAIQTKYLSFEDLLILIKNIKKYTFKNDDEENNNKKEKNKKENIEYGIIEAPIP